MKMTMKMTMKIYLDGVQLSFPLFNYDYERISCHLVACLRRNQSGGHLVILPSLLDKSGVFHVNVGNIQGYIPEFVQLVEVETLTTWDKEIMNCPMNLVGSFALDSLKQT